jgi:hypothetical protein
VAQTGNEAALVVTILALVMGGIMGAVSVRAYQWMRRIGATLAIGINPVTNKYYMEWRRPSGNFMPMRKQKADVPLTQEVVLNQLLGQDGKTPVNEAGLPMKVPPFMPRRGGVPLILVDSVSAVPIKVQEGVATKWTGFKWRALRMDIRWHQINNAGGWDMVSLMKIGLVGIGLVIVGLIVLGFVVSSNIPVAK